VDQIETVTSELIITSSLNDLRASAEQLGKAKFIELATDLIDGNVDQECPQVAVQVKSLSNYLTTFRAAREFFVDPGSSLSICCEATGLNVTAVRDKLRPETQLEFNTLQAHKAVTEFMTYRRNYVNKRKSD